jgi:molybdenum cofactor sulfurtransferase
MESENLTTEDKIDQIFSTEFPNLKNSTYLDHAASTFFPNSNLKQVFEDWSSNSYSNPHSRSEIGVETNLKINEIRKSIQNFFNAHEYSVIFTYNATHALKIVGEYFLFDEESHFVSLFENHNSALGIREYAFEKGAKVSVIKENEIKTLQETNSNNLFVFPAECNSTGKKYPLSWINQIQKKKNWKILLDASKFVSTNPMDLSEYPADFVAFSFYKIFGFPSGLGCLLIRKNAETVLKKTNFSGGTVSVSISDSHFHKNRKNPIEVFEDGTIPFLNIIALKYVLNIPQQLGITMKDISSHTFQLSSLLYRKLKELKHYNQESICEFYGNHHLNDPEKQGSILNLNFKDSKGNYIGYSHVEKLCIIERIQIRVFILFFSKIKDWMLL